MLYYEQKEIEIINMLIEFTESIISVEELKRYATLTRQEIIENGLNVDSDDNYSFLRFEKYYVLLLSAISGSIDNWNLISQINKIKSEAFLDRLSQEKETQDIARTKSVDKPIVYIDFNTFIAMKKHVSIDSLSRAYQYVYSPAHLEELANSIRENGFEHNDYIENDLDYLSKLTENTELIPNTYNGIIVCEESPLLPLKRVINYYDGTILSEEMERRFLESRETIRKKENIKVKGSSIEGVLDSAIAKGLLKIHKWYQEYEKYSDKENFWKNHQNDYEFLFMSINSIVSVIELLDNNPEPTKKYRSHLHDTSHIIYSTKADIFVTDDTRMREKITEIYRFLGIRTKLVNYQEFKEICLV